MINETLKSSCEIAHIHITSMVLEFVDAAIGIALLRGEKSHLTLDFSVWQPMWIIVLAFVWVTFRQSVQMLSDKPGRWVGLTHAIVMVLLGIPVIKLLVDNSFDYYAMLQQFNDHHIALNSTCYFMCYVSVGYFVMDSYYLRQKTYLKHHLGAILTWIFAAYHHDTSLVHGVVVITLFEFGAILVQCSRMLDWLWFRTFICAGYTFSRVSLAWYYGFIWVTQVENFHQFSFMVKVGNFPIWFGLLFLLGMNAVWTFKQWKALAMIYYATFSKQKDQSKYEDFFSFHQKIIGAANCVEPEPKTTKNY